MDKQVGIHQELRDTDIGHSAIGKLPSNVSTLTLTNCTIAHSACLFDLFALAKLTLVNCRIKGPFSVSGLNSLEELVVVNTDVEEISFGPNNRGLYSLTVNHCPRLKHLTNANHLTLKKYINVGCKSVNNPVSSHTLTLEYLHLEDLDGVDLPKRPAPRIQSMSLKGTTITAQPVWGMYPKLLTLNIFETVFLGDRGVFDIPRSVEHICVDTSRAISKSREACRVVRQPHSKKETPRQEPHQHDLGLFDTSPAN